MIVYLDEDELYPVYTEVNERIPRFRYPTVEMTEEEYQRFKRVMSEFYEVQGMVRDRVKWSD